MATLDDEYNETLLWKRGERVNAEMSEISEQREYQENDGLGGAISMLTDSDNRRILYRKRLTIKTDKRIWG